MAGRTSIAVAAAAIMAMATAAPVAAAPGAPASGAYENGLIVGVDPASGQVSGYFAMVQDGPPVMSCIFFIRGHAGAAPIDTWVPGVPGGDPIKGRLTVRSAKTLRIELPSDPDGCGNVWRFSDKDQPADFDITTPRPWIAVRSVKAGRAYFYPAAGAANHGKAYIVADDGVGVLAAKPGWVQAEYAAPDKRPIAGWLREADLYPAR